MVLVDSTMFKEHEHAIELILGNYPLNVIGIIIMNTSLWIIKSNLDTKKFTNCKKPSLVTCSHTIGNHSMFGRETCWLVIHHPRFKITLM